MTASVQLPLFHQKTPKRRRASLAERFWCKVDTSGGPDACWLWKVGTFTNAYGQFWIESRGYVAHRVSWEMTYGTVPKGLFVLHRCDVKRCVNPAHLFLGTHEDNMRDMASKGRAATGARHWQTLYPERRVTGARNGMVKHPEAVLRGERNANATLTQFDVQALRDSYAAGLFTQTDLGRAFGVTPARVSQIIRGIGW